MAQATKAAPVPGGLTESPESHVSQEEIAMLAHNLWQARGCPEGSPEEDWYRAEEELKRQEQAPAPRS